MADEKTTGTVAAIVLTSSYAWHETCNDPSTPRHDAAQGETITVSAAEFKRSQEMRPPGLAKKDSKEARAFLAGPVPANASSFAELSDAELRTIVKGRKVDGAGDMSRAELVAAVATSSSDEPAPEPDPPADPPAK